jgi:hypothetical protein
VLSSYIDYFIFWKTIIYYTGRLLYIITNFAFSYQLSYTTDRFSGFIQDSSTILLFSLIVKVIFSPKGFQYLSPVIITGCLVEGRVPDPTSYRIYLNTYSLLHLISQFKYLPDRKGYQISEVSSN